MKHFDPTPFLTQDEGQHFERKSLWEGPPGQKKPRDRRAVRDQIAEYVAAFANAEGGVLLLGIEDDRSLTGHAYPADVVKSLLQVPSSRLLPPQADGFIVTVEGQALLVFHVDASEVPVQVVGDGFPLRMGDQTHQARESSILAAKMQGLVESWESRPSALTLADLDLTLLARAKQGAGLAAWSDEDYLLKRKLADRKGRALQLRQAAELLFARLGPEHPNAGVRLFRVMGTERMVGLAHNVEELPRMEGPLPAVLMETLAKVEGLLRRPSRLVGGRFKQVPEYPTYAWQEALLNAVAHRDYGVHGLGIELWLFDDRMELSSPGALVNGLSLEALLSLQRVHQSRNPRIMRVLVDLGLARDQGEGVPRIFAEMEGAFLPKPEIQVEGHRLVVVLRNTLTFSPSDHAFMARLGDQSLTENEFRTLLLAHRQGRVDNEDLRRSRGLDTLAASQVLRRLRDRGLLLSFPRGAQSFYTLAEHLASDADRPQLGPDRGELEAYRGELGPDRGEVGVDRYQLGGELDANRYQLGLDKGALDADRYQLGEELDADRYQLRADERALDSKKPGLSPTELAMVQALGLRPRQAPLRKVILKLCHRWQTAVELGFLLDMQPKNLRNRHLVPMAEAGLLERRYPEKPTHERQAYRARVTQHQLPFEGAPLQEAEPTSLLAKLPPETAP